MPRAPGTPAEDNVLSFIAVLALSLEVRVNLRELLHRPAPMKAPHCNIITVGYRFHGAAGQRFVYAGEVFEIPEEGWIELLPEPAQDTYEINERHLPLEVWPHDVYGFRDVPMPRKRPELKASAPSGQ